MHPPSPSPAVPRVGIQVCPHAILDEGIERALDLMQATAGIETLMLNTHTYYGAANGWRPCDALATDHGVVLREHPVGTLDGAWVRHTPERFAGLRLGHRDLGRDNPYGGRDGFGEIVAAAHARGMRVHGRYLEGWEDSRARLIPGWDDVRVVDVHGRRLRAPCFAHPDFLAWWRATVEDVLTVYPLDGFFYGYERGETLADVLHSRDQSPYCFCEHCLRRARAAGIDGDALRPAFLALDDLARRAQRARPEDDPPTGYFPAVFRLFLRHPDLLAWGALEQRGKEDVERLTGEIVRATRPGAAYGTIAHPPEPNLFKTAWLDHAALAEISDYMVFRVYSEVGGPRLHQLLTERMERTWYRDLSPEARYELAWTSLGLRDLPRPPLADLATRPLPEVQPLRAARACLAEVAGRSPVLAGIGVDIPRPDGARFPSDPAYVERTARALLAEGLAGFVICREYEEISAATLRALGRALRSP